MVSVVGFFGRQYILSAHGFTARLKSSNFIFQEVNGKRPSFHPEPIPHIARLNGSDGETHNHGLLTFFD
jgi:hypothetical protein